MEIRPIVSAMRRQKTGPVLVALQVAISLAVLANALFIVHERTSTADRASGIANEDQVGYVTVGPLKRLAHNEVLAQRQRDLAALRAIPGVTAVAVSNQMPMSNSGRSSSVRVKPGSQSELASPAIYFVEESFAKTLGLRIVQGRDFAVGDFKEIDDQIADEKAGFPFDAMITLALAKLMFPDTDQYVGREFYFGIDEAQRTRIVGVVDALQTTGASAKPAGAYSVILPGRVSSPSWKYVLRTETGQLQRVMREAEDTLRKIAPATESIDPRTVTEDRNDRYRNERAMAWMLIAVSLLLLLITLSGIVGMTVLRVAQRRKEIGVRRALGARWSDIVRYFVTENLMITTAGIVVGLLLAVALNQLLMRQVDMAKLPIEYLAYGAAILLLLGVASVWGPASRAAHTSPAVATRTV